MRGKRKLRVSGYELGGQRIKDKGSRIKAKKLEITKTVGG